MVFYYNNILLEWMGTALMLLKNANGNQLRGVILALVANSALAVSGAYADGSVTGDICAEQGDEGDCSAAGCEWDEQGVYCHQPLGGEESTPEMSDMLAAAFIITAGGLIFYIRKRRMA